MASRIPLQPLSCVLSPPKIPSTSSPCQAGELSFGGAENPLGLPKPSCSPSRTHEGREGGPGCALHSGHAVGGGQSPKAGLGGTGRAWSRYGQMTFPS